MPRASCCSARRWSRHAAAVGDDIFRQQRPQRIHVAAYGCGEEGGSDSEVMLHRDRKSRRPAFAPSGSALNGPSEPRDGGQAATEEARCRHIGEGICWPRADASGIKRQLKSTNYHNAFITVSADCPATAGIEPANGNSVAGLQYALLRGEPYSFTSDDLLFEVFARRNEIDDHKREIARAAFFSKPQACLRASPLAKQYGWGLHHDERGRVAVYGVETDAYRKLAARDDLKLVPGMRNRRS